MGKKVQAPKQKDRATTEARLIEAACLIFSEAGYEGATTRMIAEAADSNVSLINRYFDGKYGLLLALLKQRGEQFHAERLDYEVQDTLEQELLHYARGYLNGFIREIDFFKVVLGQFLSDPKFLKKYRELLIDYSTHPELVRRIEAFTTKSKMNFSIEKTLKDLEIYIFGMVVLNYLIVGESEKDLIKALDAFVSIYTKNLEW